MAPQITHSKNMYSSIIWTEFMTQVEQETTDLKEVEHKTANYQ